ncbi:MULTISPECIES: DNA-binding protein WhiA [unclassified Mycoplasma]|uniref:DNA-binding protein WhiA n=1 Tax=unclassified Mycoplasma TaxID=2683645 RepID=UPI00216B059F|nr:MULTISPECIES: DNA-binding protein WhiA [unclassified Mycoplasma]MCS4536983.1 DNA-binding protein WhiA [Mycoplasma sp. CSL7475-4]MCT4469354.1 DNA-binding protein WhiA [Mycoplasma sp. HS2188]
MNNDSFTQLIKNEIFSKKKNKNEIIEFLRGFIFANAVIDNKIKLKISNQDTRQNIIKMLRVVKIKAELNQTVIYLDVNDFDLSFNFPIPNYFFAGVFVGGGTISGLKRSSYHLQLSSNYEKIIEGLQKKLNEYDFGFQKIKHKSKYLIYVKKYEKISDFLKAIDAIKSMFAFEDSRIKRDFDNSMNRINNVDVANIKKIVTSNQKHIQNINYLKQHNLAQYFNENQLNLFELLLQNPQESLTNLVILFTSNFDVKISKSGINHWLKKLDKIVNEHHH